MHHIGIHNDQLLRGHGVLLILDLEEASAADNIEELRVMVGVRYGVPVSAVTGAADIQ